VSSFSAETLHCPWCDRDIYEFVEGALWSGVRRDMIRFQQHLADCMKENIK
jgi:hypothetical protein